MGWFNGVSKENISSTTNQTTNNYTDTSANAGGDGSLAASGSGTINIQNLSESVANNAITAGLNQTNKTLDTAKDLTEFTVNTIKSLSETSSRENQDTRNSSDLALKTTAGLISQLQTDTSKALSTAQAPEASSIATILKSVGWVVAAVAAVVAIVFVFKPSKSASK